eukprot:13137991-Heterocapsa_arctica.AAC.1
MREQMVRHAEKYSAIGKEECRQWNESMNKLTKEYEMDRKDTTKEKGLHTQCKQRGNEEYHDTKWKY